ncbi:hypothetical protein C3L33_20028, partial [Rhododendron williamsianum]
MPRDRDPLVVGRVVGDIVDPFTRSIALRVSYTSREVNNGCELKPSQVAIQPRVDIGGEDLRTFFTLVSAPFLSSYISNVARSIRLRVDIFPYAFAL